MSYFELWIAADKRAVELAAENARIRQQRDELRRVIRRVLDRHGHIGTLCEADEYELGRALEPRAADQLDQKAPSAPHKAAVGDREAPSVPATTDGPETQREARGAGDAPWGGPVIAGDQILGEFDVSRTVHRYPDEDHPQPPDRVRPATETDHPTPTVFTGEADWTMDHDGSSNSSPDFLRLVDEIARLIRSSAHALLIGNTEGVARLILAQLAHKHGLGPAQVSPPFPTPTIDWTPFPHPDTRCPAHGDPTCADCHHNPGSCATDLGGCGYWASTGKHWDSCPNRIRGGPTPTNPGGLDEALDVVLPLMRRWFDDDGQPEDTRAITASLLRAAAPILTRHALLEAADVVAALRFLVDLHDGPRDEDYEEAKPTAWMAARGALAQYDIARSRAGRVTT